MRSAIAATVLLSACALPTARAVPASCEFPDGVPMAFVGETTLLELGIPAGRKEHERVYAWVTSAPVHFPSSPIDRQAACVQRADGSFELSVYPGSAAEDLAAVSVLG